MRTSQIDCNNISFERLRIKINGEGFKKHPEDIKIIKDAINNNEGIFKIF